MIKINDKEVIAIFYREKSDVLLKRGKTHSIVAIYNGTKLIWQAIRSCFGAGFWVNSKPWINDEGWKNNA